MAFAREVRRMKTDSEANVKHLMESMTAEQAMDLLKNSNNASELVHMVESLEKKQQVGKVANHNFLAHEHHNLQPGAGPTPSPDAGYGGVDKAVTMVNEMITEVDENHDSTTMECKGEFEDLCSQMEDCREAIAVANSDAADARACILNQQKNYQRERRVVAKDSREFEDH